MKIPYFFLWILYYLLTMDDRIGYDLSLEKMLDTKVQETQVGFPVVRKLIILIQMRNRIETSLHGLNSGSKGDIKI